MDRNLRTEEVAERLSLSEKRVCQILRGDDPIPHWKVGNRYRVRESDLWEWVERQKQKTNSPQTDNVVDLLTARMAEM